MMRISDTEQNSREEKLGRFIYNITYWIYAIRFICLASLPALILLYFMHKPLWLSPIIGFAVFFLWRSFRRFILKIMFRFLS